MSKNKQTEKQIKIMNLGQYVKKLNFEIMKTPYEFAKLREVKPNIEFKFAALPIALDDNDYEVVLKIEAISIMDGTRNQIFKVELEYSGVFKFEKNPPEETRDEILLVNCATMLFPFARQKLADITLSGGYQPIMLDPIDFRGVFLQSKQQARTDKFAVANVLVA